MNITIIWTCYLHSWAASLSKIKQIFLGKPLLTDIWFADTIFFLKSNWFPANQSDISETGISNQSRKEKGPLNLNEFTNLNPVLHFI